ncbi:structural protein [Cellulophaga phage Calle_1]|uniref:Structural protein n=1 Tax=Cellulophaga phage Calle_1 TaxID=2745643 RepID=A0A8E4ZDS0_9CAUD|nr:structural protein [Cellulophaga phage Calle_1]QQV89700.1 structural protein [Cellulophaga phage Calle_1]QQV89804.1 structural protein [Cellulophaga phage Calle_2]QQV89915.1 structural protein [Cellulophaga phage Calle_3]
MFVFFVSLLLNVKQTTMRRTTRKTVPTKKTAPKKNVTIKSDKSGVANTKAKKYTVKTSGKLKKEEEARGTRGRNDANRSAAFKKDVEKAGGMSAYTKKLAAAKKRVKKNPTRT